MKKMIKKISRHGTALALSVMAVAAPLVVRAVEFRTFLNDTGLESQFGSGDLMPMIGTAISIILGVLGVILVLIVIYAGFWWMTAQGDEKKVEKAKKMIYNSIIGLVIIFAAYALTNFVLDQLEAIG
ncbi:MAG: pilin [Candidatus Buchananbacteria bacterium]